LQKKKSLKLTFLGKKPFASSIKNCGLVSTDVVLKKRGAIFIACKLREKRCTSIAEFMFEQDVDMML
jgi:hypothetical protein